MMAVAKDVPPAVLGRAPQRRQYVQHRAHRWRGYSDAVMRMSEANVEALLDGTGCERRRGRKGPGLPDHDHRKPDPEFPLYTPSLLNLVKTSETHVKGLTHEG